jgi:hypothetical protein
MSAIAHENRERERGEHNTRRVEYRALIAKNPALRGGADRLITFR